MPRPQRPRRRPMPVGKAKATAIDTAGEEFKFVVPCCTSINEARIRDHLERDHFFWLDLTAPSHEDLAKLSELFGFHPLALEDTEHFGQRPKLDNYGDYIFLVFYGAWRHRAEAPEPLREHPAASRRGTFRQARGSAPEPQETSFREGY